MCSRRPLTRISAFAVAAFGMSCAGPAGSATLIFPNEGARASVREIELLTYDGTTGACAGLLGSAARDVAPSGTPRSSRRFAYPFATAELPSVRVGSEVVYVRGFKDGSSFPILEGCSDALDATRGDRRNVDVMLHVVVPATAWLEIARGNRQVGKNGARLPVPLALRAVATRPGRPNERLVLPGVALEFVSRPAGLELVDGAPTAFTDGDGEAMRVIRVGSGIFRMSVVAPEIAAANRDHPELGEVEFVLAGVDSADLDAGRTVASTEGAIVDLAVGEVTGSATTTPDLVILECESASVATCDPRSAHVASPLGGARLRIVVDFATPDSRTRVLEPAWLGHGPIGLALGIFSGASRRVPSRADIAIANAMDFSCIDGACGDTPCPCERSEVVVVAADGDPRVVARHALTSSNAMAIATMPDSSFVRDRVIVARESLVDILRPGSDGTMDASLGCLKTTPSCDALGRVRALATSKASGEAPWVLAVATETGLSIMTADGREAPFSRVASPLTDAPLEGIVLVDLNADGVDDAVWYARSSCDRSTRSIEDRCPIASARSSAGGCLGIEWTEVRPDVEPLVDRGTRCMRYPIDVAPDGMCAGDFNGDGAADLAIASRTSRDLLLFLGGGVGGLLDPPETIALPGGSRGGRLACADVDGGTRSEILVGSDEGRAVFVFSGGR